jgi:hypothetical protein
MLASLQCRVGVPFLNDVRLGVKAIGGNCALEADDGRQWFVIDLDHCCRRAARLVGLADDHRDHVPDEHDLVFGE